MCVNYTKWNKNGKNYFFSNGSLTRLSRSPKRITIIYECSWAYQKQQCQFGLRSQQGKKDSRKKDQQKYRSPKTTTTTTRTEMFIALNESVASNIYLIWRNRVDKTTIFFTKVFLSRCVCRAHFVPSDYLWVRWGMHTVNTVCLLSSIQSYCFCKQHQHQQQLHEISIGCQVFRRFGEMFELGFMPAYVSVSCMCSSV